MRTSQHSVGGTLVTLIVLVGAAQIPADDRPTTGNLSELTAPLDEVVLAFMDRIDARAAVLAVSHRGRVVVSRGYGWEDRRRSKPTQPDTTFRLASNTKPITAAIVKTLIREGKLDADLPVFPYLEMEPFQDHLGDERLHNVTVQHLLDHKGGWDRDESFDPMYRLAQIKKDMRLRNRINSRQVIQYMLSQPLQFDPGERESYSNFGYLVLGRVIEKQTSKKYVRSLQTILSEPLGVFDIHVSGNRPKQRDVTEVFYPNGNRFDMRDRDSASGLAASAPSLCNFLKSYWMSGETRRRDQRRTYWHFGSLPNTTTALMEQRLDGIDYAVMFNSRRNDDYTEDNDFLWSELRQAIDSVSLKIIDAADNTTSAIDPTASVTE